MTTDEIRDELVRVRVMIGAQMYVQTALLEEVLLRMTHPQGATEKQREELLQSIHRRAIYLAEEYDHLPPDAKMGRPPSDGEESSPSGE